MKYSLKKPIKGSNPAKIGQFYWQAQSYLFLAYLFLLLSIVMIIRLDIEVPFSEKALLKTIIIIPLLLAGSRATTDAYFGFRYKMTGTLWSFPQATGPWAERIAVFELLLALLCVYFILFFVRL